MAGDSGTGPAGASISRGAIFTLSPQANGTTKFNMREEYTGPLLPMMWRSMPDLGPSFTQFANGLKQQAETAGR